jgi:RES domain-containing protein
MIVFRIVDERYARDLSGKGSALYGGRWNPKNTPLLYCASNISLATLEVLVRFHATQISSNLNLVVINLPDEKSVERIDASQLSSKWINSLEETRIFGLDWARKNTSLVLEVPSAIVPIDKNVLINPAHFLFKKIEIMDILPYNFDNRLFKTHHF